MTPLARLRRELLALLPLSAVVPRQHGTHQLGARHDEYEDCGGVREVPLTAAVVARVDAVTDALRGLKRDLAAAQQAVWVRRDDDAGTTRGMP